VITEAPGVDEVTRTGCRKPIREAGVKILWRCTIKTSIAPDGEAEAGDGTRSASSLLCDEMETAA
jgi:hypothetical protein